MSLTLAISPLQSASMMLPRRKLTGLSKAAAFPMMARRMANKADLTEIHQPASARVFYCHE